MAKQQRQYRQISKTVTEGANYFMLMAHSDSTVKVHWGNGTFERTYNEPLDTLFAKRLRLQWENEEYLLVRYTIGSGAWKTIAFPLNTSEEVQVFDNGLCFDPEFNLLATEYSGDTILILQDLKTEKKQFIVEHDVKCDAIGSSSCIDSLVMSRGVIQYNWITPNKYSRYTKSTKRSVHWRES